MSRRSIVVVAFCVTVLMQFAASGQAQAPDSQGWWWVARDIDLAVDVPSPADVPEDGLYVGANLTGEEAISALMFVLPEGATASTLTLKVSGTIAGTAEIRLCPTIGSWQPAQGGPWAARPKYACADNAPVGAVSTDGTSVAFALGALGNERLLDVVLVPVSGANFRSAFSKPDPQALAVRTSSVTTSAADAAAPSTEPVAPPDVPIIPEAASVATPIFATDFSSSVQPVPQALDEPTIGAAPQLGLASRGLPVARTTTSGYDKMQSIGMFGLILVAAMYSRFSAQQQRPPRSLVNFGHGQDTAGGVAQP